MNTINEEQVKDILRNHDDKIKNIHSRMISLYEAVIDESVLHDAALPAPLNLSGMPGGKGGHKDLSDVLIAYRNQLYQRNEDIRSMMWELTEEESMVSRVWACFHVLDDPYYTVLHQLYVENQLYQTVEDEFEVSHKTFEKYRRDGIALLIRFYESGDSAAELMRKYRHKTSGGRKKKKPSAGTAVEYKQMCFSDIVNL